jgi:4-hydroxy-4-methyl-2-oxoglutarate aldolase
MNEESITLDMMRRELSVPLFCDAMDSFGLRNQSPRIPVRPMTASIGQSPKMLIGYCKTTLWADMAHVDPNPYSLELEAVDSCKPEDVIVCAAAGSFRSGIWGELLSTAARNQGCAGVLVDGAVRDISKMRAMEFNVYARGSSPLDSKDRQKVIDYDVVLEIDGVRIEPGDMIAADEDGIAIIPKAFKDRVVAAAWTKVHAENEVRQAIAAGMSATEAFQKFGVL